DVVGDDDARAQDGHGSPSSRLRANLADCAPDLHRDATPEGEAVSGENIGSTGRDGQGPGGAPTEETAPPPWLTLMPRRGCGRIRNVFASRRAFRLYQSIGDGPS